MMEALLESCLKRYQAGEKEKKKTPLIAEGLDHCPVHVGANNQPQVNSVNSALNDLLRQTESKP